jgi:hypothetical protein
MRVLQSFAAVIAIAALTTSCGGRTVKTTAVDPATVDVSQLWVEPSDIATRDLFAGHAPSVAPPSGASFTFMKADDSGYSPGYDVRDANGVEWSVKIGPEAQTEVVASRLLWGIGYHQVPNYYLATWTMTGGPEGVPPPARFRPELPTHEVVGEWSWYENDFTGTQPFKGLVVANLLLNNWDWKTSNNRIYDVSGPDGGVRRMYVVRDLGASLGKTSYPTPLKWLPIRGLGQGSRNDLEGFEEQAFIRGVEGSRVRFDYRGIHRELVETITPRDVVWASELLARLSDAQLSDAFRAAAYTPDMTARYVVKIKSKIAEGLALRSTAAP